MGSVKRAAQLFVSGRACNGLHRRCGRGCSCARASYSPGRRRVLYARSSREREGDRERRWRCLRGFGLDAYFCFFPARLDAFFREPAARIGARGDSSRVSRADASRTAIFDAITGGLFFFVVERVVSSAVNSFVVACLFGWLVLNYLTRELPLRVIYWWFCILGDELVRMRIKISIFYI